MKSSLDRLMLPHLTRKKLILHDSFLYHLTLKQNPTDPTNILSYSLTHSTKLVSCLYKKFWSCIMQNKYEKYYVDCRK